MPSKTRSGKRSSANSSNDEMIVKNIQQSRKDDNSPKSSPIKSPLMDHDTETGSKSFVAKCFYGLKRSKQNLLSPPKILKARNVSKEEPKIKFFQDPVLNDKMHERIANSPIKQALLQSSSVEEFRNIYRDEIKEIEMEKKLSERPLNQMTSKIVYRRNESEEEGDFEDDYMSLVDDEITFKISNRGFDIESNTSDSSSIKAQSPASTMSKHIFSRSPMSHARKIIEAEHDEESSSESDIELNSPSQENKPLSERKFFKSRSIRESVQSGGIVVGKNFNLRFVPRDQGRNKNRQKRKKHNQFIKPKRLSLEEIVTSSSVLSNQTNLHEASCLVSPEEDKQNEIDDECVNDFVVKKDCKTYGISPRHNEEEDLYGISSSLPESEQISAVHRKMSPSDLSSEEAESAEVILERRRNSFSRELFPCFTPLKNNGKMTNSNQSPKVVKSVMKKGGKDDHGQMVIDAGQKTFGATQCNVCGMVYSHADPMDEGAHSRFHNRLLEVLKFPGWKKARDVQEFPDDCGHVVMVMSDDPKYCRKKVEEMYELMGRELGFPADMAFKNPYQKVFFYVSFEKKIEGCCVAEPIKEGHRVIPGHLDASSASGQRPWCCYKASEPALLGVSRLWVAASCRRKGIATRLLDSVRQWFDYGSLIPKHLLALSDPTPDGRRFAEKYFGTQSFLVYKYH